MHWIPVANFHIRNGATVQRLNWNADKSGKNVIYLANGFEQSFGMMINYNYILDNIEENNQKYKRTINSIYYITDEPVFVGLLHVQRKYP